MAISVDWAGTQRIFVPRADMPVIQVSPEVRQLDLDDFRLELKDLEANRVEGIVYPDTHRHVTEALLSGIPYARLVEILDPYTVEFEDGQYTVVLVGANTNLGDVKVANQVSLTTNNSAGLINLNPILARLLYQGEVWIDTLNGNAGQILGENGTPSNPVDNLADAIYLANELGVKALRIVAGGIVLNQNFDAWSFTGAVDTSVALNGQSVNRAQFSRLDISGAMTGSALFESCVINSMSGFQGEMTLCGLIGPLTIAGFSSLHLCHSDIAGTGQPIVDFNSDMNAQLSLRDYTGGLRLQNIDDALNVASLDFNSGSLTLDNTVTDGTIVIRGIVGGFTDNSGPNATLVQSGRVDPFAAQRTSFEGAVFVDTLNGTSGTDYPLGQRDTPCDNFADALAIAATNGLPGLHIEGAATMSSGDFSTLKIMGTTPLRDTVTVSATANVTQSVFEQLTVQGTVGQPAEWFECRIEALTFTGGVMINCAISNDITLQGPFDTSFIQCAETEPGLSVVTLDCGGGTYTGQIGFHDFFGALTLTNKTTASDYQIDISSGTLTIDSTCTAGTIRVTGQGVLVDNSGAGCTVDATGFNPGIGDGLDAQGYTAARAVLLDELDPNVSTTTAAAVHLIRKVTNNRLEVDIVGQQLVLYDDDGTTPLRTWALSTDGGEPVVTNSGVQTKRAAPV